MNISHEQFEQYVADVLDALPDNFKDKLHNVAILIEERPTREQMDKVDIKNDYELLGLFEGYIQSKRINFGPVLPDRISIFRKNILDRCSNENEIKQAVRSTVLHEIAHHFGSDEKGAQKAGGKKYK